MAQGICLQQLRNQYTRFEIKPPIVFSTLASNVAYLLSKGIRTNAILDASSDSFILHCCQVHQEVLETRIVKCFIANSYQQLSSSVELFQFQKEAQSISPTFEGYEDFILNSQDEIMNFIRKSFFRNSIENLYRLNASTILFDHFNMIRQWILDLLESVCLLHERGLAHGGIKAANIFVNQDTNKIYLTDFGFGRKNELIHRKLKERELTIPPEKPENLASLQFKDVYALVVLIYQMTFGFDCSQPIIQNLQFGTPFDETEQGDNPNDNEESEFKYLIVKLMNRIVCGRAANSTGQSIFYVSDILHLRRGIDSPKNSPRNIEKVLLQTLGFNKETNGQLMQSSFGADNSPQVDYIINRKEKQLFEEEKQNEEVVKSNVVQSSTKHRGSKSMLLTIQEQVEIYKKSDFERYQEHSESNKKSNPSSEKIKSCNIIADQPDMSELNRIEDIIQVYNPKIDFMQQVHKDQNQEILQNVTSEDQNSNSKEINGLNQRKMESTDSKDEQNHTIPATCNQTEPNTENVQSDNIASSEINQQKDYVLCFQNTDYKLENDQSKQFDHDKQLTQHKSDNKYEDCWEFDFSQKVNVQKGDDIKKEDYAEVENNYIKNMDQKMIRQENINFINLAGAQQEQLNNQQNADQNQIINKIEEINPSNMKIPTPNQFQYEGGNEFGQRHVDQPIKQFEEAAMQNYEILRASNGTIIYQGQVIEGNKQGLGVLFNEEGQKIYEGYFLNNQYHGKGREFYENGNILHDGEYSDGYLQGFARSYNKDGSLNYEGTYKNGLCDGEGAKFNEKNVLISIGQYSRGKLNGQLRRYFEDGKIELEGTFKNNRRDGQSIEYYRNGQVQCSILYRNGRKIEGQEFNQSGEMTFNGKYEDQDLDIC